MKMKKCAVDSLLLTSITFCELTAPQKTIMSKVIVKTTLCALTQSCNNKFIKVT